jgi:purine-binding chemotaxis protein CheW
VSRSSHIVVFTLDDLRYGLPLDAVDRVVRIVDIMPLPKAPAIVVGAISIEGRVVAVVNIRSRFRLPERSTTLSDQMIVARTSGRRVALVVDAVEGVFDYSQDEIQAAETIAPGIDHLAGVVKVGADLVLIQDLGRLLSLDEGQQLDTAIAHA